MASGIGDSPDVGTDADHGVWLGGDPPERDRHRRAARPNRSAPRWLAIVGALVAVWLVVVLLGRFAAPDDEAVAPTPTPTPEPTAEPTPRPTPSPTEVPEVEPIEDGPVLGVDQGVVVVSVNEAQDQLDRISRQMRRRSLWPVLSYRSAEGIVMVDLAAGTPRVVQADDARIPASQSRAAGESGRRDFVGLVPSDVLLRAAGETYAIDPEALTATLVADDASLIATDTGTGHIYWVEGRDLQGQAAGVSSLLDGEPGWQRAPHASQLVVFDGLGLAAVSKVAGDGTGLFAGETQTPLSEHRVISATSTAVVEEVCDAACRLEVRSFDGEAWTVPDEFVQLGDRFVLAPNGAAILRHTPHGFSEIYDSRNRNVSWVTGASLHHVAWSDDSSFVVWLDLLGSPELRVMLLDDRDWLRVDLEGLGLPRPLGTEIALFRRTAVSPDES